MSFVRPVPPSWAVDPEQPISHDPGPGRPILRPPEDLSRFDSKAARLRDEEAARAKLAEVWDVERFERLEARRTRLWAGQRERSNERNAKAEELRAIRDRIRHIQRVSKNDFGPGDPVQVVQPELPIRAERLEREIAALDAELAQHEAKMQPLGELVEACRRFLREKGVLE